MAYVNAQGDAPLAPVSELFSLQGKTAVCTGATGGLGLSMSIALAEAGADIVSIQIANDPRADMLKEAVAACGQKLQVFETNVADSVALRRCFAEIWAAGVVPDILLNCAGINRRAKVEDFTDEDIDAIYAINQKASFVAAQEVGKKLLELKRPGKIINIASIISFIGNYNIAAYAATKGAVLQMTKAMSNEWAKHGINVNCICPGYIMTAMTKNYTEDKEYYNYIIGRTPAGRWGLPEDFRGAIIFLASKASDFVCGTSLVVDGGMIAK
ncbi:hypothetical protein A1O7_04940 [Cladophialophora yegresii CBS 114405]|uniref:2-deoxy-D-gluconate 3-dehydrogenase n=1 Tax=Cladophialophora yegresii CBS 114405 TaxID=1182544 RepID=W9VY70_9EURO|nr:uncharacterized protein A1O7_04940 [Cladophialophora yegresii CBS 114405]EXJ60787.1 hypothetical protein A1O7_04940 [Cladophialophora yegresii CBS 114405]